MPAKAMPTKIKPAGAFTELLGYCDRLKFEPHDIARQLDARGGYEVPLAEEFGFAMRLFHYSSRRHTRGATWHERLELFVPLDARVRMGAPDPRTEGTVASTAARSAIDWNKTRGMVVAPSSRCTADTAGAAARRTHEVAWEDPSRPMQRKEGEKPSTFAINARFELPILSEAAKRATGLDAVRAELLHRRDDFARGFAEKMMTYALGRGLLLSDYQRVETAATALKKDDYHLHSLIRAMVQSPAFQTR